MHPSNATTLASVIRETGLPPASLRKLIKESGLKVVGAYVVEDPKGDGMGWDRLAELSGNFEIRKNPAAAKWKRSDHGTMLVTPTWTFHVQRRIRRGFGLSERGTKTYYVLVRTPTGGAVGGFHTQQVGGDYDSVADAKAAAENWIATGKIMNPKKNPIKPHTFKLGDVVRQTGAFLRSIGSYSGNPVNGVVCAFVKGLNFPVILWSDGKLFTVNPNNLEIHKAGQEKMTPGMRATYIKEGAAKYQASLDAQAAEDAAYWASPAGQAEKAKGGLRGKLNPAEKTPIKALKGWTGYTVFGKRIYRSPKHTSVSVQEKPSGWILFIGGDHFGPYKSAGAAIKRFEDGLFVPGSGGAVGNPSSRVSSVARKHGGSVEELRGGGVKATFHGEDGTSRAKACIKSFPAADAKNAALSVYRDGSATIHVSSNQVGNPKKLQYEVVIDNKTYRAANQKGVVALLNKFAKFHRTSSDPKRSSDVDILIEHANGSRRHPSWYDGGWYELPGIDPKKVFVGPKLNPKKNPSRPPPADAVFFATTKGDGHQIIVTPVRVTGTLFYDYGAYQGGEKWMSGLTDLAGIIENLRLELPNQKYVVKINKLGQKVNPRTEYTRAHRRTRDEDHHPRCATHIDVVSRCSCERERDWDTHMAKLRRAQEVADRSRVKKNPFDAGDKSKWRVHRGFPMPYILVGDYPSLAAAKRAIKEATQQDRKGVFRVHGRSGGPEGMHENIEWTGDGNYWITGPLVKG